MGRKQFLLLVLTLLILGGVGFGLFWQDLSTYRASGAKIGAKLIPELKVADVAQVELRNAKSRVTLVRKENWWVVQERGGYPADFKAISDLIIKLSDLKVVQAETVGESLWARVELVEPAQGGGGGKGEGAGTQVELKDAAGKTLVNLILGKTILKKDPGNPLPSAQDGVPAGRYVRTVGAAERVVVVSDPLAQADASPGRWLDKTFMKADRLKTLAVAGEGTSWKLTREAEWEPWKLVGGGEVDPNVAVRAANAIGQLAPTDVAGDKAEEAGSPIVVTAETFDALAYTFRLAKRKGSDDYLLRVNVAGEPPRSRVPEKGEKPEERDKRDKEFAEGRQRLEARLAREKAQSVWTYIVDAKQVEPLLKPRAQLIAVKAADQRGKAPAERPPAGRAK